MSLLIYNCVVLIRFNLFCYNCGTNAIYGKGLPMNMILVFFLLPTVCVISLRLLLVSWFIYVLTWYIICFVRYETLFVSLVICMQLNVVKAMFSSTCFGNLFINSIRFVIVNIFEFYGFLIVSNHIWALTWCSIAV